MENSPLAGRLVAGTALVVASLAGSFWAVPVLAQTRADAPASPNAKDESQLEDIIVQARRTKENQQSVPLAITTVSGDRLKDAAATSVSDIQRLVPALQIGQDSSGFQVFTIRGAFNGFGTDSAVIDYIDEVPVDSRALVYSLFDLDSVQVLKGSQGTLFGRNSTGGAVLFFSKKPDLGSTGGYLTARYGNLDERRIEGAINLPLSPTFGIRVAGEVERRDGYLKSVTVPGLQFGTRHNEAFRAAALWRPRSSIENYTQFIHYRQREHAPAQQIISLAGPCTGPATPAPVCLYQPPFAAILGTGDIRAHFNQERALPKGETVNNNPNLDWSERNAVTNNLLVDLGGVSVRNILYYGDTRLRFGKDYDGTPVRIFDKDESTNIKTFYSETQLFGRAFDRLDWRVGGVYSHDDIKNVSITAVFPLPISATQPRTGTALEKFQSTALFAQATMELLHSVSLTGGFRYTWDDRKMDFRVRTGQPKTVCALQTLPVPTSGAAPFPHTDLASCTRRETLRSSDYNYNLTLDWKPTDKLLLYATARRGYKAGSFNLLSNRPDLISYAPETVQDLELGIKADWKIGGIPFRANIAAFRSKYTNIQVSTVQVNAANGDINVVVLNQDPATGRPNKATIRGFEIETFMAPAPWLQLSAFYSRLGSKYDQFIVPGSGANLVGQNVAGVVPETYGGSAQASVPLGRAIKRLDLTASYYMRGAPQTNVTSTVFEASRPNVDARLTFRDLFYTGGDLSFYAKNIAETVRCPINTAVTGGPTQLCGEPRTYGAELTIRFGGDRR